MDSPVRGTQSEVEDQTVPLWPSPAQVSSVGNQNLLPTVININIQVSMVNVLNQAQVVPDLQQGSPPATAPPLPRTEASPPHHHPPPQAAAPPVPPTPPLQSTTGVQPRNQLVPDSDSESDMDVEEAGFYDADNHPCTNGVVPGEND